MGLQSLALEAAGFDFIGLSVGGDVITGGSNPDGSGFMYNNWLMLNWDGPAHKCGVTRAGGVLCWGAGGAGQLGQGSYTDSSTPVQIARNLSFVQVAVGAWHACAVDISGGAWCWGRLVHMCGVDGQDVMEVVVGLGGVYPSVVHFMVLTSHTPENCLCFLAK